MLTEAQKQKLADGFMNLTPESQKLEADRMKNGPLQFNVYDYTPLSFEEESNNIIRRAGEAASLGIYEAPDAPFASAASGVVGELVGTMAPALAGYGIGGAIARRVVPNAARAAQAALRAPNPNAGTAMALYDPALAAAGKKTAQAMAKRVPMSHTQRGAQLVIGETLPGGMQGYIKSDGDVTTAIATAAEWMAGGLIFEGAFVGMAKAFRSVRAGEKLTDAGRASLVHFDGLVQDAAKRTQKIMNKPGEALGTVMGEVIDPRIGDMARRVANGATTRAEFLAGGHSMINEAMEKMSTFTAEGRAFFLKEFEGFHENMYARIKAAKISGASVKDAYRDFFRSLNKTWDNYNAPKGDTPGGPAQIEARAIDAEFRVDDAGNEIPLLGKNKNASETQQVYQDVSKLLDDKFADKISAVDLQKAEKRIIDAHGVEMYSIARRTYLENRKLKSGAQDMLDKMGGPKAATGPINKNASETFSQAEQERFEALERYYLKGGQSAEEAAKGARAAIHMRRSFDANNPAPGPRKTDWDKILEEEPWLKDPDEDAAEAWYKEQKALRDDTSGPGSSGSPESQGDMVLIEFNFLRHKYERGEITKEALSDAFDKLDSKYPDAVHSAKVERAIVDWLGEHPEIELPGGDEPNWGGLMDEMTDTFGSDGPVPYGGDGSVPPGMGAGMVDKIRGGQSRKKQKPIIMRSRQKAAGPVLVSGADYKPQVGKSGMFKLKDDKQIVHGVVTEIGDDPDFFTLQIGKEKVEIHRSQVETFQPDGGPISGGSAGGRSVPISQHNTAQIYKLKAEYEKVYGHAPRGFAGSDVSHMNQEQAQRIIRSLQIQIRQEINRSSEASFVAMNRGDYAEPSRQFAESESIDSIYGEDTAIGWFSKLFPTYARHGLSANKPISIEVRRNLHQMEEWGKQTSDYLTRYYDALEGLSVPMKDRLLSMMPGAGGAASRTLKHKLAGQKIKLARALDGDGTDKILRDNPELQQPYDAIRSILDNLANDLGLPMGDRISSYFPHVFHGSVGQYMAKDIAQELGQRGAFMSAGVDLPTERLFANLLERTGAEGFQLDLDAAMYAYIRGAVKKPGMDEMLRRSQNLLEDLPMTNNRGKPHVTRKLYNDYVRYLAGQPGSGRIMMAQFWQNNKLFNHWVDRAVGFMGEGDQQMSKWISQARKGDIDPTTGQRADYDVTAELEVRKYFKKLVDDANQYTKEGELKNLPGYRRQRAKIALKIDEIRNALQDPKAKPLIISNLYGLMVVNKLGLNISHGLINLTQTLTNTYPKIGITYVAKGMSRYTGKRSKKFSNGKTTQEVLDDLGVLSDTAEAQEFLRPGIGWRHEVQEGLMAPARITEKFNRGVAGLGSYEKLIRAGKGHEEAIELARDLVLETQFPFNKAGVSPIMQTPLTRFLLMFKSYPMHQINFSYTLLENMIKNPSAENAEAFTKHIMSYVLMAGVGASVLGGSNFGWKAQHPIEDILDITGMEDALQTLGGPPSSALIDLLHGQVMDAAREVAIPVWKERLSEAVAAPTASQGVMELMGMQP